MNRLKSDSIEDRVLILAPTGRDGTNLSALLTQNGFNPNLCSDLSQLIFEADRGVASFVIAEEAITKGELDALINLLKRQEPWSDLPLIVIGGSSVRNNQTSYDIFAHEFNFTLLERPLSTATLVTTLRSSLRSRRKQYEIRNLLRERTMILDAERAAREQAVAANRMKDDFLAVVSHELRNPLNSILGFAQLLKKPGRTPEQIASGLEIIERNSRAQASLIDDLLDITRIVTGKLRVELDELELSSIVNASILAVKPSAEAKNIQLVAKIPDKPVLVLADISRLQQVVSNLLTNAVKFSEKNGKVEIELSCDGIDAVIQVRDSGVGISEEFLPLVFDRFRQASNAGGRGAMGLGLGLSIVKHLMELHNGSVKAESPGRGKGSTFTVCIPLHASNSSFKFEKANKPETIKEISRLSGIKVLTVDDEPDSCQLIKQLLEDAGAEVEMAGSVLEALSALERFKPSILLSDLSMPDHNGYELLARIRKLSEERGGKIPAIAVTAFARPDDKARCMDWGFQGHVSKPIFAGELIKKVVELTSQ